MEQLGSARRAHNPKVAGSTPALANYLKKYFVEFCVFFKIKIK